MGQESTPFLGSWIRAAGLPREASRLLHRLLAEDPIPVDRLRADLAAHLGSLTAHSARHEFIDLETATLLNSVCHRLLDRLADGGSVDRPQTEDHRRMVQAAVRYFLLDDDAESDLHSPIGFDDDAQVVRAVAAAVGAGDLTDGLP